MISKPLVVYAMIMVKGGKEKKVIQDAKNFPGVKEVQRVYGEYDIIAKIELSNMSILEQTVTMIRRIPGITKTVTLISMER